MSEERIRPTPERMRMAQGQFEDVVLDTDERGRKVSIATVRMLDTNILAQLVKDEEITGDQFHAGARVLFAQYPYLGKDARMASEERMRDAPPGFRPPKLKCAKCDEEIGSWQLALIHECKEEKARCGPTPERIKQAQGQYEEVNTDTEKNPNYKNTVKMMDDTLLERLRNRDAITARQFAAGEQLRKDYDRSRLNVGAVDTTMDRVDVSGHENTSDQRAFYLLRYEKALFAVGEDNGHVLIWLVIFSKKLEEYGSWKWKYRKIRDAKTSALTALRLALDALDRHYYPNRKARTVHSHVTGYRPVITES